MASLPNKEIKVFGLHLPSIVHVAANPIAHLIVTVTDVAWDASVRCNGNSNSEMGVAIAHLVFWNARALVLASFHFAEIMALQNYVVAFVLVVAPIPVPDHSI